jgi:aminoglycoside phosphotransferase (APT) family kinase protein
MRANLAAGPSPTDEPNFALPPSTPTVKQFRGGASNLTYLLTFADGNKLVLRRPPAGYKAASAHDMGREVAIQLALKPSFGLTPRIYGYCSDELVIGSEFYVMEYLDGVVPRASGGAAGTDISPAQARTLAETFVNEWARLHALSPEAVGLDKLHKGPGYVQRQVTGWSSRYQAAHTDDVPTGDRVIAWLQANAPGDSGVSVIHNDWRFDNMVFDFGRGPRADANPRLVGVLDWELATVGDPLMDIGSSLAYWVEPTDDDAFKSFRRQPTNIEGMPTRDELVAMYAAASGRPIDDWVFYQVFGLFRLAGIVQQIWFRYRRGETTNPAFKQFGLATNMLINRAESLIAT